ncbi:MAG: VCBS repeat-containing protein [Anaerolineales bacterium]|nr:VCBS repeat-containing protein [Anaerolineales bacterium]
MLRKRHLFFVVAPFFLLACGIAPSPTSAPMPTEIPVIPTATPSPPAAVSPGENYQLVDEVLLAGYGIRLWQNTQDMFAGVAMIEKENVPSVRIEMASAIETITGTDLNGDGYPDAVIETYSGGAHCCFGTQVYSLGERPLLLFKKPESNAGGQFQDINGDGIYEFVTYDDVLAYQYCAYAESPFTKVIMIYDAAQQSYLPASPRFPEEYAENIQRDIETAASVQPGDYGEWDETAKCGVLPLLLDYAYLNQFDQARNALLQYYPYDDAEAFWNEVMLLLQDSPLYVRLGEE